MGKLRAKPNRDLSVTDMSRFLGRKKKAGAGLKLKPKKRKHSSRSGVVSSSTSIKIKRDRTGMNRKPAPIKA